MEVESLPTGCGLKLCGLANELRIRIDRLVEHYLALEREMEER